MGLWRSGWLRRRQRWGKLSCHCSHQSDYSCRHWQPNLWTPIGHCSRLHLQTLLTPHVWTQVSASGTFPLNVSFICSEWPNPLTLIWVLIFIKNVVILDCRSFETQLSRVEAELLRREAPPSYGQLIAQGLIPPVEDFPVCSGNQVHIHISVHLWLIHMMLLWLEAITIKLFKTWRKNVWQGHSLRRFISLLLYDTLDKSFWNLVLLFVG